MTATMSLTIHALLPCDLCPSWYTLFFRVTLPLSHHEAGSHSPLLESGLAYDSYITTRMQQKWLGVTSEASRRGHVAPTWFFREACSSGRSTTWDHHAGKATRRHSAEPSIPIIPTEMLNMWVRKPSWKWTLQPQPPVVWVTQPFESSPLRP